MTEAKRHDPNPLAVGAKETAGTVISALLIALMIRVELGQPYTIPSESMEPGLLVGDYILVSKFDYGWSRWSIPLGPPLFHGRVLAREPSRGDVVVFAKPGEEHTTMIKWLIGVPGDQVQVRGGVLYRNDRPVARTPDGEMEDPGDVGLIVARFREMRPGYVTLDRGQGYPGDDTEVFSVPAGHYFFMGDNRDNSADSRFPQGLGVGLVPAENLIGKARWRVLSWQPGASLLKPWTWLNLRGGRAFQAVR